MTEFHFTHIALVGARMPAFKQYGFNDRNQLAMRRVPPHMQGRSMADISQQEWPATLVSELPIWIHNIIADPGFPGRDKMLMPLRRFEGELLDSKNNEVVAAVLSAGFKNQALDPLNLPSVMPLRQRCAIVMHISVWQEAYRKLEDDLISVLAAHKEDICDWVSLSRDTRYAAIE